MHALNSLAKANQLFARGESAAAAQLLEACVDEPECAVRLREWAVGEHRHAIATAVAERMATGSDAEAWVSQAVLALLRGNAAVAERAARQAIVISPDLPTALNHWARALHNLGRGNEAAAAFAAALRCAPDYPEAWHNRGIAQRAGGDLGAAESSFRHALRLAPGFLSARLNLGITLYALSRPVEALQEYEAVLSACPEHVEALVNAGLALHLLGRTQDATERYHSALALAPTHAVAHYYLGCARNELMDTAGAIIALEAALRLDPEEVDAWAELAGVFEQSNQLEKASRAVAAGLARAPGHPALRLEAAKLERRSGDGAAAMRTLSGIDSRSLPDRLAQMYWFEYGHAADRVGDVDRAMAAFTTGNALAARSLRRRHFDVNAFGKRCAAIVSWLDRGAPGATPDARDPQDDLGADLCFLLGFPRSGTTLLDTMLDAHPAVVSIEELPTLEPVVERLATRGEAYPDCIAALRPEELPALRALYRAALKHYLCGRAAEQIVDKLPLRCLHAALVHRLFPRARMLFALRHPCDVVLSNFMQQYAPNEAFVHFDTLEESAVMYDRVLSLWQRIVDILPLRFEYVRYEAMVEDEVTELGQVCRFLGLDPSPAMFDLKSRLQTRERVRTNSYQQVAEPLYQRARGRWLRYRRWIDPLLPRLRPHLLRLGYAESGSAGVTDRPNRAIPGSA